MIYLAVVAQIMAFLLAKRLLVAWYNPVVILVLLWTLVLSATAVLAPDYYFSGSAYLLLLLFEMTTIGGAVVGVLLSKRTRGPRKGIVLVGARVVIWVSFVMGLVSTIFIIGSKGLAVSALLNLDALFEVSREFSLARYEDQYRMPIFSRLTQMLVFFSAAVAGLQFVLDRRSMRGYEFFLPIVPLILIAILLTTRASVIFGTIFWISGYGAGRLWESAALRSPLFGLRGLLAACLGLLAFSVLFVALQFMRGGITDINRLPEVLAHLRKWPFGSFAGFSVWFDQVPGNPAVSYGYYTFTGLFDLLGIRDRETGLYLDYVDVGGGAFGNIYTVFRGLIEDFTIAGACAALFMVGLASSLAISLVMARKVLGVWLLVAIYPIVVFSPIVSFYSFFGHVMAVIVLWMYLRFFTRFKVIN